MHSHSNITESLKMMHQKTQEKREIMKTICYDASVENNFFPKVKNSIYKLITRKRI